MLAGAASRSRRPASATNWFTRAAVRSDGASRARTGRGGLPRVWGSVSDRRPPSGAAAQDQHEAMFLHGLDQDLDPGQPDGAQALASGECTPRC